MIANSLLRDEAKEQARERLPEILDQVLPGFRPERPFRCLNPSHEDRHPSMRYMAKSHTVRCFACGWHGDVFDVIGAVYGLDKGEAFARVFDMLGLQPGKAARSFRRPSAVKSAPDNASSGREWAQYLVLLIYPPGWDDVENVVLPKPLEVLDQAESRLIGCLGRHPELVGRCITQGLQGRHFDNTDLGILYEDMAAGLHLEPLDLDRLRALENQALPPHMVPRTVHFLIEAGRRRLLAGALAQLHSHRANGESPDQVLERLFAMASAATGCRYSRGNDGREPLAILDEIYNRFHACEDAMQVIATFRCEPDAAVDAQDSDWCLVAACVVIGLGLANTLERASVLEFDSGLTRDEANRNALILAMKDMDKRYSVRFIHEFFDAAGLALLEERKNGWPRKHTVALVGARLAEAINGRV